MVLSQTVHTDALREFAVAVSDSLGKVAQRELPSMYLYDELGTALFEAITLLPEYGLTRAEDAPPPPPCRSHASNIFPPRRSGRAGKRQRPKDPLDIGSARGSRAGGLFPHRHFGGGPHQVPPRTGKSRRSQHGRTGEIVSGRVSGSSGPPPTGSDTAGLVPRKHHRQFRSAGSGEIFCATSAGI